MGLSAEERKEQEKAAAVLVVPEIASVSVPGLPGVAGIPHGSGSISGCIRGESPSANPARRVARGM
jgi:hypothetical protein